MSADPSLGVSPATRRFPRWLLVLGAPLLAVVLVGFFVFLRFPFDRFGDALAGQLGALLGAEVAIGGLDPALTLGGPGFVAREVRIAWPDGARAIVSRAALRPAWSASWLRGAPALHLDAESDLGAVRGAVRLGGLGGLGSLGGEPGFDGRLEGFVLARLPLERLARGASLEGTLDLTADLRLAEHGPVGDARFEARDGSVSAPNLPIAVPYEALRGAVRFEEDGSLALEDVRLEGPMVSGRVEGGAGPSPSLLLAPLDLKVHLEVSDRNLRPAFGSAGLSLRPDGTTDLTIRGNLAAPVIR